VPDAMWRPRAALWALMTGTEAGPTGLMVGPASLPATFQTGYMVFLVNR